MKATFGLAPKTSLVLLGLATTVSQIGCQSKVFRKQFDPPSLPTTQDSDANKEDRLQTAANLFVKNGIAAQNNSTDKTQLKLYYESGIACSNEILNLWFSHQFKADREFNHFRNLSNIVGNTTVGVLGFTGAEAKQLGLLGLGLAGVNSEFDNFTVSYMVAPVLYQVKMKLDEGRSTYAETMRQALFGPSATTPDLPTVQRAIASYHQLASRIEIQSLISRSVEIAKFTVPDPTKTKPTLGDELAKSLTANLEKLIEVPGQITPNVALGLFVSIQLPTTEFDDITVLEGRASRTPAEESRLEGLRKGKALYDGYIGIKNVPELLAKIGTYPKPVSDNAKIIIAAVGPYLGGPEALEAIHSAIQGRAPAATSSPSSQPTSVERAIGNRPQVME